MYFEVLCTSEVVFDKPPTPKLTASNVTLITHTYVLFAAMAWEEFSDFLRRTIERNINGPQFDFDTRQWSSSIRKWCNRAVEMDVQAKAVSIQQVFVLFSLSLVCVCKTSIML